MSVQCGEICGGIAEEHPVKMDNKVTQETRREKTWKRNVIDTEGR